MEQLVKNKKIFRWIDNNIKNIKKGQTILILGATGSMASYTAFYLAYLNCNLILAARNVNEATKLKEQLSEFNVDVEVTFIDFGCRKSIDEMVTFIKNRKIDVILNNIGIYHQPTKFIEEIEWTFYINYLAPFYLFENLKEYIKFNNIKIVNVGSISYLFKKVNYDDIQSLNVKNKTLRYSQSKNFLISYSEYLKNEGINSICVHPGISTTNLFSKKNNAYPKIFYVFVVPIMKIIFMSHKKAALTLLKGCNETSLPRFKRIGPRGLFHSWGFPNVQTLRKKVFKEEDLELKYSKSIEIFKNLNN